MAKEKHPGSTAFWIHPVEISDDSLTILARHVGLDPLDEDNGEAINRMGDAVERALGHHQGAAEVLDHPISPGERKCNAESIADRAILFASDFREIDCETIRDLRKDGINVSKFRRDLDTVIRSAGRVHREQSAIEGRGGKRRESLRLVIVRLCEVFHAHRRDLAKLSRVERVEHRRNFITAALEAGGIAYPETKIDRYCSSGLIPFPGEGPLKAP